MIYFLLLLLLIFIAYSVFISYHAYRWARIIFSLEEKYSVALAVLERTDKTFGDILKMQIFFDSPSIRNVVLEAMEDIKSSKVAIGDIITTLVQHSKKKYIEDVVVEE